MKSKLKQATKTSSARSQPRTVPNKGKSAASKSAKGKKPSTPQQTPTLFSGHEGAELRGRVDRYLNNPQRQASGSPATTYSAAYREAVRTKNGTTRAARDSNDGGDVGVGYENDDEANPEDGQEGSDEEGGGNDDGENSVEDEPEEVALDEEEEREMRTVKGKGKENAPVSSARTLRFGGVVMLSTPFPKGETLSKPTGPAIKTLEKMGLATFDADGFVLPPHATYEEVDQVLGDLLPTPIDYLRSRLDGDEEMPVWELLKPEYRKLHRTNVTYPAANDVRATWGDGRSIAAKVLFICPTLPFSKKVLARWRSDTTEEGSAPAISEPNPVRTSRKRKPQSPSELGEDDENCDDIDHEHKRPMKKLRVMSPVDAEPTLPLTPHKMNTRGSTSRPRHEVDLTNDDDDGGSTGGPLRECQVWATTDTVFLLSSPDKDLDPYTNTSRYFGGL